jgi:hypothetical protein
LAAAALGPVFAGEKASNKDVKDVKTGFLVIAPDRGFAGSEEIADAFDAFAKGQNASVVFMTDERSSNYLKSGLDRPWPVARRLGHARAPHSLTLPVETVGGLGSSPLFASALLDRAPGLSRNPSQDTVILVAHGSGDDRLNQQWEADLEVIAEHVRKAGGSDFLAIRTATWREDWANVRDPQSKKIRSMVEDAARQGGRVLVIPARTVGEGPEGKFLSGLEYDLGSGFAPHPNFLQWMEEQIKSGVRQFNNSLSGGMTSAEAEDDTWSPEWAL